MKIVLKKLLKRNMELVIRVSTVEGEDNTRLTEISDEEYHYLEELISEIKKHNGYFATGRFRVDEDPKPEILYSGFRGWNILISRLPTPISGIKKIEEFHFFNNVSKSIYI